VLRTVRYDKRRSERLQGRQVGQKKKTVRRQWTRDDVKSLKTLAKQTDGVKKIAKAFVLGLSLDTRV
jgi:hypothetical protein